MSSSSETSPYSQNTELTQKRVETAERLRHASFVPKALICFCWIHSLSASVLLGIYVRNGHRNATKQRLCSILIRIISASISHLLSPYFANIYVINIFGHEWPPHLKERFGTSGYTSWASPSGIYVMGSCTHISGWHLLIP
ncbi:hypothetical protein T4D_4078 [Trichinella pseudospiralis]|uniref:Uncharacterized protein n=1 Tax=Trichinella pseudospiralis TaxID=6337 RepID=A0A0V1G3N9_TRIPS|nr:hypothetical protein T4D_4078 [Trichinella pseudospiralis]